MAWHEVVPVVGAPAAKGERVSIRCTKRGVRVAMSEAVAQSLGWVRGKTKLRLLVGSAEAEGKLRLAADVAGTLDCTRMTHRGGLSVRCGRWPDLTIVKLGAEAVAFDVPQQGVLELTLPAALLPAAKAAEPRELARPVRGYPVTPGRDLTASLMGDPPPGRSAADRPKSKR